MNTRPIGILVSTAHPSRRNALRPIMTAGNMYGFSIVFGEKIETDTYNNVFLEGESICALFDRFPFQTQQTRDPLQNKELDIPISNPRNISYLCRDKWALQKLLIQKGLRMPDIVRGEFGQVLQQWGGIAIAKPRHGSSGVGISIVNHPPSGTIDGIAGIDETLLQQYIHPPQGWAGIAIRQLIQRNVDQTWQNRTTVLRCSKTDPIVNVARGAQTIPAKEFLSTKTLSDIHSQSIELANILAQLPNGEWLVELGIDFVLDAQWQPWLIEVNSQPKGKLKSLAKEFPEIYQEEHLDILSHPLRYLYKQTNGYISKK